MVLGSGKIQGQHLSSAKNHAALGIGLGLPYGALGIKFGYNPANNTTLFGGLGYNFVSAAFNVGLLYSFPSKSQTEFYLTGMYGTNRAIRIEGLSSATESYHGPSFGIGIKINSLRKEGSHWDIGLLVPISPEFEDDFDTFESQGVDFVMDPWPVLISVGYNFSLGGGYVPE